MKKIPFIIFYTFSVIFLYAQTLDDDLINAVYENNDLKVFDLIRQGASADAKTDFGVSALMYAVQNGNYLITEKLLEAGADPNYANDYNPAPLINAVLNSDTAIIYLLLSNGANPNVIYRQKSLSPLDITVKNGNIALTEMLLDFGANPDFSGSQKPPVFYAIDIKNDTTILSLLIDYGANVNVTDYVQRTPLIYAVKINNYEAAKILLKSDANVYKSDNFGKNAIDYAIKNNNEKFIELFSEYINKNPEKYFYQALNNNNIAAAKKIRIQADKKFLMPYFSHVSFSVPTIVSYDDFFTGFCFGISETRYNFQLSGGFNSRLWRKRILVPVGNNTYEQYWEKRNMLSFGITKFFFFNNAKEGIYLSVIEKFSYGEYSGTDIAIANPKMTTITTGYFHNYRILKTGFGISYFPFDYENSIFMDFMLRFYLPLKN